VPTTMGATMAATLAAGVSERRPAAVVAAAAAASASAAASTSICMKGMQVASCGCHQSQRSINYVLRSDSVLELVLQLRRA